MAGRCVVRVCGWKVCCEGVSLEVCCEGVWLEVCCEGCVAGRCVVRV